MASPSHRLLALLAKHREITVGQAAIALGISAAAVSRAATRLAAHNYATRDRDDLDQRLVHLRLTSEGRRRVREAAQ